MSRKSLEIQSIKTKEFKPFDGRDHISLFKVLSELKRLTLTTISPYQSITTKITTAAVRARAVKTSFLTSSFIG